jgi:thioredoxin 1
MMGPILDEVAEDVKDFAKVGKVNVDENPDTAGKYEVMSIPTLIIFKEGKPVKTMTGVQSKEALTEELKNV